MTSERDQWQDKERAQRYARQTKIGATKVYGPFAKKIVQSAGMLKEGATIVDLGTGPGLLAVELHRLWPQARIIAVDPSTEMLQIARENAAQAGLSDYGAKQGAAEDLPLESGCCNLVISQSSFHEWEDPGKGLAEIHRILVPGGRLIMKDYNRDWLSGWKGALLGRLHPLHMFKFGFGDVASMAREVGFEQIQGQSKGLQYFFVAGKRGSETT